MARLPKPATIAVLIVIAAAWRLLPAAPAAIPVRAVSVDMQNMPHQTNGVVTVRSLRDATIRPQIDGPTCFDGAGAYMRNAEGTPSQLKVVDAERTRFDVEVQARAGVVLHRAFDLV